MTARLALSAGVLCRLLASTPVEWHDIPGTQNDNKDEPSGVAKTLSLLRLITRCSQRAAELRLPALVRGVSHKTVCVVVTSRSATATRRALSRVVLPTDGVRSASVRPGPRLPRHRLPGRRSHGGAGSVLDRRHRGTAVGYHNPRRWTALSQVDEPLLFVRFLSLSGSMGESTAKAWEGNPGEQWSLPFPVREASCRRTQSLPLIQFCFANPLSAFD